VAQSGLGPVGLVSPQDTPSSNRFLGGPKLPKDPKLLGRDYESNCSCKQAEAIAEGVYRIVCFGQLECKTFPRNFNTSATPFFSVRTSAIAVLRAGDLDKMRHLTSLAVENASPLETIEPGFFRGMRNLVNLSISFNKLLTHLDEGVFEGLVNLTSLNLVDNGFKAISDVTIALHPQRLPVLDILHLDRNSFDNVTENDFSPMVGSPVSELYLTSCSLHNIHPLSLLPLHDLTVLKVDGNLFLNSTLLTDVLENMVRNGRELLSLGLDGIGLNSGLPPSLLRAIASANVTQLVLSDNTIEEMTAETFPPMPNLRYLDLSKMHLVKVGKGTFGKKIMPALERLNLCCNKLTEATPGLLPEQLIYLDLSSNSAEYFKADKNRFVNMTSLKHLYLTNNKLVRLNNETFAGLRALEVLYIDNATIFKLDHGMFDSMRNLEFLNLERNRLQVRFLHPQIFSGLGKLKTLLLGGNELESLGDNPDLFIHLKSLTYLGLQGNDLVSLDYRIFHPLVFLQGIDLTGNQLSSWPKNRMLFDRNKMLRQVDASRNYLTILNEYILHDLEHVMEVDLSKNPFHCGCDFFQSFLRYKDINNITNERNASITRLLKFKCRSPEQWQDITILEFVMSESTGEACATAPLSVPLQILLPSLFLCLLVVGFLLARFNKRVCHFWFWVRDTFHNSRGFSARRNDHEMSPCANYQYDAFVSYSNEDRPFVLKLVSMLEEHEPFFKLCVYERDFSIGAPITDAIVNSVTSSRKVLLIVSDSFTRSNWCSWETHVAHHQRVAGGYGNEEGLLVIKLGKIHEADLSPTLRYLLRTRVYLEYDPDPEKQRVFWKKLREALGKRSPREMATGSYINNGFVGHSAGLQHM